MKYTEFKDSPGYAQWVETHAAQIKAAGTKTTPCRICRSVRVPTGVHACPLCD